MARKPSDIVQPNLRIRELLRRKLKREADKNRVSLNVEMMRRLERSLDQEAEVELGALVVHFTNAVLRLEVAVEKATQLIKGADK